MNGLKNIAVAGCFFLGAGLLALNFAAAEQDEFEQPPIRYSDASPRNRISQLLAALERKEVTLRREGEQGYLPGLLKQLKIPVESQMLVFSKTSLQRGKISPRTPRAIYFNEDVYIGYCHDGDLIEISVADPQLGAVFYTLDQASEVPKLERQTQKCLICHASSRVDGVPSHLVRSLYVDPTGMPILSEGSSQIDSTSPIDTRWGGWYVTGTHGDIKHLGNLVVRNQGEKRPWKNQRGQNVTDLRDRFSTEDYLSPHSDIVALMVFEHQTYVHNHLAKANFVARQALHYEEGFNKALGEPLTNRLESTTRRVQTAGDSLVEALLCVDEAPITDRIAGNSGYAEKFTAEGPRDAKGRSLRELDLQTRLLKYPCSYLIYSSAFDELPPIMKEYVCGKLRDVLSGKLPEKEQKKYAHLSAADRAAITEILKTTKPEIFTP